MNMKNIKNIKNIYTHSIQVISYMDNNNVNDMFDLKTHKKSIYHFQSLYIFLKLYLYIFQILYFRNKNRTYFVK